MDEQLEKAYAEYQARQSRDRHPHGKFDKGSRWYPSEDEWQSCCNAIRSPSRAFPYSYMTHCRTSQHVAHLFGVDPKELKNLITKRAKVQREGGENYFKLVAVVGDKFLSIYDGQTEYQIGQEMKQAAHQDHQGGYYVHASADEAKSAAFPDGSTLLKAPRALLRVRAEGNYCRYDNKLAFSRITPLEVVAYL